MTRGEARADVADDVRVLRDEPTEDIVDLTEEAPAWAEPPPFVPAPTSVLRRYRLVGMLLIPIDVACLAVALLTAHVLRFGFLPEVDYLGAMAVAAVLWVAVFAALGLYAPHHLSWLDELRRTVSAVGLGIVAVILLTFWLDVYLSRSWMAITLAIAFVLEIAARRVVRAFVSGLHARGVLLLRTLVIGTPDEAPDALRALRAPRSGFLPLGYVDVAAQLRGAGERTPLERVASVRGLLRRYRPDCVLVASPTVGASLMLAVMQAARQEGVLVRVHTHLSGILASRVTVHHLSRGDVALAVRPAGLSPSQRVVKRAIDVAIASIVLVVTAPVLLATAVVIRATSGSPVFFRQERVTEGNRTFWMLKFRTMAHQSASESASPEGADLSAPYFKAKSDPRVTRVGRWFRRFSIDELPQLFNVLIGDMSLVGPRPLPAEQVTANIELLGPRHEVRSGITGWWQIHGRSDVDHEEAIRMDHFYIENWSASLDLYILLRTIGAVVMRRGAY